MTMLFSSCDVIGNGDSSGEYGVDGKTPLPKAVDMGVKVNGKTILWASCNLGASKPKEIGDYYAWGETTTKNHFDWNDYKFCSEWEKYEYYDREFEYYPVRLSKYNTDPRMGAVDRKIELDPEDDVVRVKLGGKWRMPSYEDYEALLEVCDVEWDIMGDVMCVVFISRITHNKIVFPSGGFQTGDFTRKTDELFGQFWLSTLYEDTPKEAWFMYPDPNPLDSGWGYNNRCTGRNIRPVREK